MTDDSLVSQSSPTRGKLGRVSFANLFFSAPIGDVRVWTRDEKLGASLWAHQNAEVIAAIGPLSPARQCQLVKIRRTTTQENNL
jgi:hypothetical protein